MKRARTLFILLFCIGAAVRGAKVTHPIDGSVGDPWRECDVTGIARNYYREGMHLFYPRIDWRGDGPGYVEMEFPLQPWTMAALYKVVGYHESLGRFLSFAFSLLTLGVFFSLARRLLSPAAALAASAFFALSPLVTSLAAAVQPDGLMLGFYVVAAYAFIVWLEDDSWLAYVGAVAATALAILAKANAAHLGFLFLLLLIQSHGARALRDVRVWAFAALSLLPAIAWYSHARGLWLTYGNSLGVSSEYHWIGWDLIVSPGFWARLIGLDLMFVWMPSGAALAALALLARPRTRATQYGLAWLAAVAVFLFVAGRTTAQSWAVYYHAVAVFPAALLFGAGAEALVDDALRPRTLALLGGTYGVMAVLLGVAGSHWPELLVTALVLGVSGILLLGVLAWRVTAGGVKPAGSRPRRFPQVAVWCLVLGPTFALQTGQIRANLAHGSWTDMIQCAHAFAAEIPRDALVVTVGGPCYSKEGYPLGHEAPFMLFWADRKGFSLCEERFSVDTVRSLVPRGARFLFVSRAKLGARPGLESELRAAFPVKRECGDWIMFALTPAPR
ncbi:MAG: glycosyltransferase family 39 protein [Gemmatimonadales bacterium]|jgi:hypothetical protein